MSDAIALAARVKQLEDALRKYADPLNWTTVPGAGRTNSDYVCAWTGEGGVYSPETVAKVALSSVPTEYERRMPEVLEAACAGYQDQIQRALKVAEEMEHEGYCASYSANEERDGWLPCNCARERIIAILKGKLNCHSIHQKNL